MIFVIAVFFRAAVTISTQVFILGMCRGGGIFTPKVLYSTPKELASFCIVRWIPLD